METRVARSLLALAALAMLAGCPGYGKGQGIGSMNSDGDKPPPGISHLNTYGEDDVKEEKWWSGFYGDDHSVKGDCSFYGNCQSKESALGW
jgi:hypothetical protein